MKATPLLLTVLANAITLGSAWAGPYAPAAGQPGSTAIAANQFSQWASGYTDLVYGTDVSANFQTPNKALGAATGDVFDIVSLGNGGRITLTFNSSIFNGPGADFAIFENSFNDTFLELAWVEVSSNGTQFLRFPNFSLTANPVNAFGSVDPTNIDGLAGKYRAGFGTPFDLDIFANVAGFDVNNVRYVRVVDIVGDGNSEDSLGRPIYDPTPTVGSGGFDLDAVGVLHLNAVPLPPALGLFGFGSFAVTLLGRRRNQAQN